MDIALLIANFSKLPNLERILSTNYVIFRGIDFIKRDSLVLSHEKFPAISWLFVNMEEVSDSCRGELRMKVAPPLDSPPRYA